MTHHWLTAEVATLNAEFKFTKPSPVEKQTLLARKKSDSCYKLSFKKKKETNVVLKLK